MVIVHNPIEKTNLFTTEEIVHKTALEGEYAFQRVTIAAH